MQRAYTVKVLLNPSGLNLIFKVLEEGLIEGDLLERGLIQKFKIKDTNNWLETLKKELDREVPTLKHMKLEIGNITMKYIMSTH